MQKDKRSRRSEVLNLTDNLQMYNLEKEAEAALRSPTNLNM